MKNSKFILNSQFKLVIIFNLFIKIKRRKMSSTFKSSNELSLYNPSLTKSKWSHRAPSVDAKVNGSAGTWANSHMYRTSSNDMSHK